MEENNISEELQDNSNIINIESIKSKNNISLKNKNNGYFNLSLYLDDSIFYNDSEYNKFIKATERLIRTSDRYSEYIAILKGNYGLNYCMVLGNVASEGDVTVEMHHGPLLTLFDIVSIVTNSYLARKNKVTTFRIADVVLREHFNNNIQVIMLSKTVHEAVHNGKIFIHPKQTIGNIQKFLEKYEDGLTEDMIDSINKYVEISESNEFSTDNGYLKSCGVKEWKQDDSEDFTMDDEEE